MRTNACILTLALALAAGCGGGGSSTSPTPSESPTPPPVQTYVRIDEQGIRPPSGSVLKYRDPLLPIETQGIMVPVVCYTSEKYAGLVMVETWLSFDGTTPIVQSSSGREFMPADRAKKSPTTIETSPQMWVRSVSQTQHVIVHLVHYPNGSPPKEDAPGRTVLARDSKPWVFNFE